MSKVTKGDMVDHLLHSRALEPDNCDVCKAILAIIERFGDLTDDVPREEKPE